MQAVFGIYNFQAGWSGESATCKNNGGSSLRAGAEVTASGKKSLAAGRKQVLVMSAATAISLFGDAMLYIVLPIYWAEMGIRSLWHVGILLSVNRFIRLPLNPLVAWLYYKITYKQGLVLGLVLAALTTISYGVFQSFWMLLIARCLWGLAWSFIKLGAYLYIPDLATPQTRGYLFGLHKGLYRAGTLTGMVLGGLLVHQWGLLAVTLLFGSLSLLYIPVVLLKMSNDRSVKDAEAVSPSSAGRPFWRESAVVWIVLSAVMVAMVYDGMLKSSLSLLVDHRIVEPWTLWGWFIGAAAIGGMIQSVRLVWEPWLSPLIGKLVDRSASRVSVFLPMLISAIVLFVLVPLRLPLWLWVIVVVGIQLTATMIEVVIIALTSDVASGSSKVAVMTSFSVASDLGAALGPVLAFAVGDLFGTAAIYWSAACVLLILAVRWLYVYRVERVVRAGNQVM